MKIIGIRKHQPLRNVLPSADEASAFRAACRLMSNDGLWYLSKRVFTEGRMSYGPLMIEHDRRNWGVEVRSELLDACWYAAVGVVASRPWSLTRFGWWIRLAACSLALRICWRSR